MYRSVLCVVLYSWYSSPSASADDVGIRDRSCGWCKRDKERRTDGKGHRQTYRKRANSRELMTFVLWRVRQTGKHHIVFRNSSCCPRQKMRKYKKRVTTKLKWREHTSHSKHTHIIHSRGILQDVFVPGLYNTIPFGFHFPRYIFENIMHALVTDQTGPAAFFRLHLRYYFL